MTVTQPSQNPDKDPATAAWEQEMTETTNRLEYQVDNINQTVVTSTPRVAIYSHTSDGAIQSFTPPASGDGYVSYFAYTDALPTLPVSGLTFNAFSDDEIDFKIRQYIERAVKPVNPGTVTYNVANGSWLSSNNWTKTKLVRGATNVWYCEAHIVGTTGSITTKWGNPRLLYGGQTGSGILYYTTAEVDGSAPGKPLADGYDFESGAFTNLRNAGQAIGGTNGWSYTPITVTIGGGTTVSHKHWQCVFNVEVSELTEHTTQLSGVLNAGATTVTVDSTAGFPIPSTNNTPLTIYIGSEQITYTGVTNTTFTGCVRGANSTSDVQHADDSVVTTRLPVQIITFETPTGFVPIGSNLQSDNFNGDLSNGTQGTAGWGISRTGNAIFNGVQVRGSLNADDINAGTINASNVAVTNIDADNITAGTLNGRNLTSCNFNSGTLTVSGTTNLNGSITAPHLNAGVIMQAEGYNAQGTNATNSGTVNMFVTSNNADFDTDIVFYMGSYARSTGSYGQTQNTYLTVAGVTQVSVGSAKTTNNAAQRGGRIQVGKGQQVAFTYSNVWTDAENNPGTTYWGSNGVVFEVRRIS
tara:strand:+ start:425 stop:2173 length:1749 start_codon:yes stop_codon:yes gene_type:complete